MRNQPEHVEMELVSIDDLRMSIAIQLKVYHGKFVDALTARQRYQVQRLDEVVDAITNGWEHYAIYRPRRMPNISFKK